MIRTRSSARCAQIGKRVHLSAAAQIGGVLEPVNAIPVVIEDDCLIGGNTGVYEGTIVRERAVLASGVILTRSTPVFDLVNRYDYQIRRRKTAGNSGGRGRRAGRASRLRAVSARKTVCRFTRRLSSNTATRKPTLRRNWKIICGKFLLQRT
ncbi:MAG: DapH/DapD/GlmU-related protein [Pyrinomonadaceae bacterium]